MWQSIVKAKCSLILVAKEIYFDVIFYIYMWTYQLKVMPVQGQVLNGLYGLKVCVKVTNSCNHATWTLSANMQECVANICKGRLTWLWEWVPEPQKARLPLALGHWYPYHYFHSLNLVFQHRKNSISILILYTTGDLSAGVGQVESLPYLASCKLFPDINDMQNSRVYIVDKWL